MPPLARTAVKVAVAYGVVTAKDEGHALFAVTAGLGELLKAGRFVAESLEPAEEMIAPFSGRQLGNDELADVAGQARSGKPGAPRWGNSKSVPTYGHTFSDHTDRLTPSQLIDRARSFGHQVGQCADDETAAQFIADVAKSGPGVYDVSLPPGMGRSFLPDGTELRADMARVVVRDNGAVKTAFPYDSNYDN
jgi:hypothetical protein